MLKYYDNIMPEEKKKEYKCACVDEKPLKKNSSYNQKQITNRMRIAQILKSKFR